MTAIERPGPAGPSAPPDEQMVFVPGGTFRMGSEDFYPEERPVHRVAVDGFWMDRHPVTVAQFRRFVKATGYRTLAERAPDAADYPGADPAMLVPGALVFHPTRGPVDLGDVANWWQWVPGAAGDARKARAATPTPARATRSCTSRPRTRRPTPRGRARRCRPRPSGSVRPAVTSTARPTPGATRSRPAGRFLANFWQGEFPWRNERRDGFDGTSPVESFPPNGFGLHDMTGNVWEWTADFFSPRHPDEVTKSCCVPHNPRVTSAAGGLAEGRPGAHIPRRVVKGGSHLCAANYCLRYRPAARQAEAVDTSTSHIGFRCIVRP